MTREDLERLVELLQKELKDVKETKNIFYNSSCMWQNKYNTLRNTLDNILKLTESN